MSPGIASFVLDKMTNSRATIDSPALQKLTTTVGSVAQQATYHQAGFMAARLREHATELDKSEMDWLIGRIREAQDCE